MLQATSARPIVFAEQEAVGFGGIQLRNIRSYKLRTLGAAGCKSGGQEGREQLEPMPRRGSLEQAGEMPTSFLPDTGSHRVCLFLAFSANDLCKHIQPQARKDYFTPAASNEIPGPSALCCRYSLCRATRNIKHNEHIHHLGNVLPCKEKGENAPGSAFSFT